MKTTLVTISLLLTVLAAVPGATAAAPPVECSVSEASCEVDDVARCVVLEVGASCSHYLSNCLSVLWGVHQPGLVVGGYNTCNVTVWADPGAVAVHQPAAAGAPCDVSPTWPGGYATCTVAGKEVTCTYWTGPLLEVRPDMVSCGVGLSASSEAVALPCAIERDALRVTCTPEAFCLGDFHADGFVRVWSQGCTLGAQVAVPFDMETTTAPPCTGTGPTDFTCTTPAGSCTLFLNRWSYGGCETVLPCSEELRAEFGPYTVEASSCRAAFDIIG